MKIGEYRIVRDAKRVYDLNDKFVQQIHVEFDAQVDESEFKAIFDMLMTGHILKEEEE